MFAENGYDFHTIDQRGFGYSEGRRGVFESQQIIMDDLNEFTEKIDTQFGGKDVPHFLVGQSMGGFLSARLSVEIPERFAGMSLLVPFFGLYDDTLFRKAIPFAKALNWVRPAHPLKLMQNKKPAKWMMHW